VGVERPSPSSTILFEEIGPRNCPEKNGVKEIGLKKIGLN
jgi:hypothetical protein